MARANWRKNGNLPGRQTRLSSTGSAIQPQALDNKLKTYCGHATLLVGQTCIFLGTGHERFSDGCNSGMLDRHNQPFQSNLQNFIHGFNKSDRQTGEDLLWDFRQVFLIVLRKQYGTQAHSMGGQKFFFYAADRQNLAPQGDFAGHGHVAAHRNARQARSRWNCKW